MYPGKRHPRQAHRHSCWKQTQRCQVWRSFVTGADAAGAAAAAGAAGAAAHAASDGSCGKHDETCMTGGATTVIKSKSPGGTCGACW